MRLIPALIFSFLCLSTICRHKQRDSTFYNLIQFWVKKKKKEPIAQLLLISNFLKVAKVADMMLPAL